MGVNFETQYFKTWLFEIGVYFEEIHWAHYFLIKIVCCNLVQPKAESVNSLFDVDVHEQRNNYWSPDNNNSSHAFMPGNSNNNNSSSAGSYPLCEVVGSTMTGSCQSPTGSNISGHHTHGSSAHSTSSATANEQVPFESKTTEGT